MGAAGNGIPQRHRITGFFAVAVSLRAGKRTKMNCAHMAILQRSDTLQLSKSGRGRVSFQNGRKHIVISFLTDHHWVTETGRAGTESREPTHGPARSPSAHRREGRHHRTLTHEDIKKAPGGLTSEGSKGRRLPTLPPLLGQYHRHKCV